jgi:hypothetical protein
MASEKGGHMRRIMVILIGSVLLMGLLPPAGAQSLPRIYAVDHIRGDWVHRTGPERAPNWYVVQADIVTDVRTGEIIETRAQGGVGECTNGGNSCWATLRDFEVVSYEPDALFQTARLVVRRGNRFVRLDFVANVHSSSPYDSIHPCRGEADTYTDVSRSAWATGSFFGRRVSSHSDWHRINETMQREIYTC